MSILAKRVLAILTRYGVEGVFRTYATTGYEPATGVVALGAATEHTHKIVPPYAPRRADLERWSGIDGVQQAEALSAVAAAGLTFTPAVGQALVLAGKTWTITTVHPVRYLDAVVLYEFALCARVGG